jgi:hypothetical protein
MRLHRPSLLAIASILGCGGAGNGSADSSADPEPPVPGTAAQAVTACGDNNSLKNAYFGDLHTHTSYSLDAYVIATRVDPAGAYAFAAKTGPSSGAVKIASAATAGQTAGPTVTIDRALDFLAVTDHSEFFNVDYGCTVDTSSPYYNSQYCVDVRNQGSTAQATNVGVFMAQLLRPDPSQPSVCLGGDPLGGTPAQCAAEAASAWQRSVQATAAANNPCTFTSLVAYEWTATTGGNNLHRNVIFQNESVPSAPLDYINYPSAHDLWAGLSQQCTTAGGCAALTIAHNSNASGGQMFTVNDADVDYMVKYQTLVEIFQHKGNSECLSDPADSGYDAQCSFELLPNAQSASDKPGYVRSALESGLAYYASHTGSAKKNPLQLGIVAATDTHNSTPGNVKESTWPGHLGVTDNTPVLRVEKYTDGCDPSSSTCTENNNPDFNPGGITGVWAEQNTRDRIFAALQRREVFGTSGPRIKVRFYQYSGAQNPCSDPNFPQQVVNSGGVPMGGTMGSVGAGSAKFVVYALKDNTDLAEIDIFKASVVGGQVKEQLQKFTVSGGSACITWTDTGYSASAPALYYARVLEQPTPRWSHNDCDSLKQTNPSDWQTIAPGCLPGGGLDVNIRERAWSSPIWNLP